MGQFALKTQSTLADDGSPTEHANPWARRESLQEAEVKSADDAEHPFKCHLVTASGHTCGLTFATWRTSTTTIGWHARSLASGLTSHCHQRVTISRGHSDSSAAFWI